MHRLVSTSLCQVIVWLPSLDGRTPRRGPVYRKLAFEPLEERCALSATPLSPLAMPLPFSQTASPGIVLESTDPQIGLPIMDRAAIQHTSLSSTGDTSQTTSPAPSQQVALPPVPSSPAAKTFTSTPTPATAVTTPFAPSLLTASELTGVTAVPIPPPLLAAAVVNNQSLGVSLFGSLVPGDLVPYSDSIGMKFAPGAQNANDRIAPLGPSPNPARQGESGLGTPGLDNGREPGRILRKSMYRGQDQVPPEPNKDGSPDTHDSGDGDLHCEATPRLESTVPDFLAPEEECVPPDGQCGQE